MREYAGECRGCFFCQFTLEWATALGVTGWVRNDDAGTVEVMAEGERDALAVLRDRLAEGPPLARVEAVEVSWEPARGEFIDFRVCP